MLAQAVGRAADHLHPRYWGWEGWSRAPAAPPPRRGLSIGLVMCEFVCIEIDVLCHEVDLSKEGIEVTGV